MEKYRVKLMPRAVRDLDEIYNYIAGEFRELSTAEQMANLLEDAILGLNEMPYRGSIRKTGVFANKGYRQILVKNFTIAYRIDEEQRIVIIVTVRYSPSCF